MSQPTLKTASELTDKELKDRIDILKNQIYNSESTLPYADGPNYSFQNDEIDRKYIALADLEKELNSRSEE